jgi:hypothetical protein
MSLGGRGQMASIENHCFTEFNWEFYNVKLDLLDSNVVRMESVSYKA